MTESDIQKINLDLWEAPSVEVLELLAEVGDLVAQVPEIELRQVPRALAEGPLSRLALLETAVRAIAMIRDLPLLTILEDIDDPELDEADGPAAVAA